MLKALWSSVGQEKKKNYYQDEKCKNNSSVFAISGEENVKV